MKKIIRTEVTIELPLTPNFLKMGDKVLPIKDFSEKEIKTIAREWTKELLAKWKKNKNL